MESRLKRKRRHRQKRKSFLALLIFRSAAYALVITFIAGLCLFAYAKLSGPPPLHVPINSTYYGVDDVVIAKTNQTGINREWVPLEDISDELIEATIAIEDKRFYNHFGFDIRRIVGSALANIQAGARVEGASTITMQLARNIYLSHEKTWIRKVKETLYAIRLELNYSKDDILEGYLNTIYYGHGAYGIEEAANYYFQKRAKDLSLSEASLLAGVPKGPSYYSPQQDFDKAKERQEVVLEAMASNGYISENEELEAKSAHIQIIPKEEREKSMAPYFLDAVEEALIEEAGLSKDIVEAGGLNVYTTLNTTMQQKAESWIEETITDNDELQTALVSIEPTSGAVRALVGGRNYEESSFNRALKAKRAPGSTFKPFLYYAALENGFTPSTPLLSEETTFTFNDGADTYSPSNFDNRYADDFITLAQAIAVSDNTYAVKTHLLIGLDKLIKIAKQLGISNSLPEYPSLALGTEPVSVMKMTQAYAVFANEGMEVTPYFIEKVTDKEGNIIYEYENNKSKRLLDEDLTFLTTHLMTGMFNSSLSSYASVTGASIQSILSRPMAGKSGTTSTDSWMIGYTPQLVTTVWTGYDKGKTLHSVNDTGYAKRIWAHYMEDVLESEEVAEFQPTANVSNVTIDPLTGQLATDQCEQTIDMYYINGSEPTEYCPLHYHDEEQTETPLQDEKKWWEILLKPFIE